MKNFQYINASDIETVARFLQAPGTVAIAGGTDLITELKKGIRAPAKLVDLKAVSGMHRFNEQNSSFQIGSLTTIAELESNPHINNRFPILSQAAATIGSLQLRNVGTLGGNICQTVRCWYYRHPEVHCWLKNGDTCYARNGNNRHHALFGKSPCVAVNPSDIAPVLVALDAKIRIASSSGSREVTAAALYTLPEKTRRKQFALQPGELIEAVEIPLRQERSDGRYLKVMERANWSFALVSAAVQVDWNGEQVQKGRIVLGGVAGMPWRVTEAEDLLTGRTINESVATRVSEVAVSEAKPLEWNRYKIPMVKNVIKRAILELKPQ